jgi:hypothetical protein
MALCVIALLSFFASQIKAQTKDTTHWNDEELYVEEAIKPSYFAVGGGVLGGVFLPNFTDLNKNVAQPFVGQDLPTSVFMLGGQGFITLPWIKNFRVGGMGYGGTTTCDCQNVNVAGSLKNRMLTYSVGYGALTMDYVLPLGLKHFSIVPGLALGFGSVKLNVQQAENRASAFDITDEFGSASTNITHTYHNGFFLYMPQLQFEYSIKGFSMIRATIAYQGTSMRTWMVDNGVSLGTTDKLATTNGSGLVASVGVFFGLFP